MDKREQARRRAWRERVAHHEAGHVVADVVLGLVFKGVQIYDADDPAADGAAGAVHRPRERGVEKGAYRLRAHPNWVNVDQVISCLAGFAAERIKYGRASITPSRSDLFDAYDWACRRGVDGGANEDAPIPRAIVRGAHQAAKDLLHANWAMVEAVAAALLDRGRLSRKDVSTVISKTLV